jgi:membrane protease YdiL (CAAX protease family)
MPKSQLIRAAPRKPWQDQAWVRLFAAVVGVLPLYSILLVLQVRGGLAVTLEGFTFYLAVISPVSIVVVLLLLRFLCGESPPDLNLRSGKVPRDLLATLILSVVIVVTSVTSTFFLSMLFANSASSSSVRNLFVELASHPKLLALFAGPLLFLGAASEELVRVFLLSRLWKVWPSLPGKFASVGVSALLFGLIHVYQGPVSAVWTGIFGLIMAFYYLRFGRAVPMVLAHYVTNAMQVIVFAAAAR